MNRETHSHDLAEAYELEAAGIDPQPTINPARVGWMILALMALIVVLSIAACQWRP